MSNHEDDNIQQQQEQKQLDAKEQNNVKDNIINNKKSILHNNNNTQSSLPNATITNNRNNYKGQKIIVASNIWDLIFQEARSISLWAFLTPLLRICIALVCIAQETRNQQTSSIWMTPQIQSQLAVHTEWIYNYILPGRKYKKFYVPGFVFANPWMLVLIHWITGVYPSIPIRVSDYTLRKLCLSELVILLFVHFVCTFSTFIFLANYVLPENFVALGLEPVEYADGVNSWIMDLSLEVLVSTIFSIVVVIGHKYSLPTRLVILSLTLPILFQIPADAQSRGSIVNPNALLGLSLLFENDDYYHNNNMSFMPSGFRVIAPLLGGLIGGKLIQIYKDRNITVDDVLKQHNE